MLLKILKCKLLFLSKLEVQTATKLQEQHSADNVSRVAEAYLFNRENKLIFIFGTEA